MTAERINLEVTEAARAKLLHYISRITEFEAMAAVLWFEGGTATDPDGLTKELLPGWDVGFYDPKKIPAEAIQTITGIKFVFGQGAISERLNGKTLDIENGRFVVRDTGRVI